LGTHQNPEVKSKKKKRIYNKISRGKKKRGNQETTGPVFRQKPGGPVKIGTSPVTKGGVRVKRCFNQTPPPKLRNFLTRGGNQKTPSLGGVTLDKEKGPSQFEKGGGWWFFFPYGSTLEQYFFSQKKGKGTPTPTRKVTEKKKKKVFRP